MIPKLNLRTQLIMVALLTQTVSLLHAQTLPTVRIDPFTHASQQVAPFDRSFDLLLPVDTTLQMDEITRVQLSKFVGWGDKSRREKLVTYKVDEFRDTTFVDTPKVPGIKYFRIRIDKQLLPGTRFSILLFISPSHLYFDQLNDVNYDMFLGSQDKARQAYDDIADNLTVGHSATHMVWPYFRTYQKYYSDTACLGPVYTEISKDEPAIGDNIKKLTQLFDSADIKLDSLLNCNCQKDLIAHEVFRDSTKYLIPLHNLLDLPALQSAFAAGLMNVMEFEPYKQLRSSDFKKRLDNLDKLQQAMENISRFFHFSTFGGTLPKTVSDEITAITQQARMAIENEKTRLKTGLAKIRKKMNSWPNIANADFSFGGTSPNGEDIQTSSGHFIIPDFGLASVGTFVNNRFQYSLLPYLGVNFSLIPIDKSVSFKSLQNKRVLHHLSLVLGLTTTSLGRAGISDLVKNMSVVTGLAYRINRSLRLTSGVLIYKRNNSNPVLPQRPTVGPMLALSLDLDVAKWFGDIKGKLF